MYIIITITIIIIRIPVAQRGTFRHGVRGRGIRVTDFRDFLPGALAAEIDNKD